MGLDFVSIDFASALSMGCATGQQFERLTLSKLSLPFGLAVVMIICMGVSHLCCVFEKRVFLVRFPEMILERIYGDVEEYARNPKLIWVTRSHMMVMYASVLFLFFLSMCTQITSFFTCEPMPDDKTYVVYDRRDVRCGWPWDPDADTVWNNLAPVSFVVLV